MFSKKTKVDRVSLPEGHLVWVHDGQVIDMGPASVEDLKLLAYVCEQAKAKLASRKNTASYLTLSRVESLARRLHDKARLTQE